MRKLLTAIGICLLVVVYPMTFTGCSTIDIAKFEQTVKMWTPAQKAEGSFILAKSSFDYIYDQSNAFTPANEMERTVYNNQIVPGVNKLKGLMAVYGDSVKVWLDCEKLGKPKPEDFDKKKADAEGLLDSLLTVWGSITKK